MESNKRQRFCDYACDESCLILSRLNNDVLFFLFLFTTIRDKYRIMKTCKRFYNIVEPMVCKAFNMISDVSAEISANCARKKWKVIFKLFDHPNLVPTSVKAMELLVSALISKDATIIKKLIETSWFCNRVIEQWNRGNAVDRLIIESGLGYVLRKLLETAQDK